MNKISINVLAIIILGLIWLPWNLIFFIIGWIDEQEDRFFVIRRSIKRLVIILLIFILSLFLPQGYQRYFDIFIIISTLLLIHHNGKRLKSKFEQL